MILGCDGVGKLADGTEVVIHSIVNAPGWRGEETLDPQRTLLTEKYQGTFAEVVLVPEDNVIVKPQGVATIHAAVMGTAWLTAYRMLFVKSGLRPGQRMLIQGASGGVSTALIQLGTRRGYDSVGHRKDGGEARPSRSAWAHMRFSRQGAVSRTGWTSCSRQSVRRRGPTPCGRSAPAGLSSVLARRPDLTLMPNCKGSSSCRSVSRVPQWVPDADSSTSCSLLKPPAFSRRWARSCRWKTQKWDSVQC